MKKRLCSMLLALVMLFSLSTTAFASGVDEGTPPNVDSSIIASEEFSVPISLSLEEFEELKPGLEKYNIPYSIQGTRAIAVVDVSTTINYDKSLYFCIVAQCETTLLQKITGSISWKYKTTGSYSTPKKITVNYQDDFGIPRYTLTCIKYTGKTFKSGTTISADFNIDIDATNEVSGGAVSRTVTGVIP